VKSHSYRVVSGWKSYVLSFICKCAFFTDIFPYLNCLNLCGTNLTQSIKPMNCVYHSRLIIPRLYNAREIWKWRFHSEHTSNVFPSTLRQKNLKKQQSLVILDSCLRKTRAGKAHDYRAVILSKSFVLRFLFASVQMFFIDIFPCLNCFNLFVTKVTQSIKPMNYVYHAWLITPPPHYARKIWKRRFTLKLVITYNSYKIPYFC